MPTRYQCNSCSTALFYEQSALFAPWCPTCRSNTTAHPAPMPDTLDAFQCLNCETAFFMTGGEEPYTCPKCNAFRFQKNQGAKTRQPDSHGPNDTSNDTTSSSEADKTASPHPPDHPPPTHMTTTQDVTLVPHEPLPQSQLQASSLRPAVPPVYDPHNPNAREGLRLDVIAMFAGEVLIPALIGLMFGTTGLLVGLGIGVALALFTFIDPL